MSILSYIILIAYIDFYRVNAVNDKMLMAWEWQRQESKKLKGVGAEQKQDAKTARITKLKIEILEKNTEVLKQMIEKEFQDRIGKINSEEWEKVKRLLDNDIILKNTENDKLYKYWVEINRLSEDEYSSLLESIKTLKEEIGNRLR